MGATLLAMPAPATAEPFPEVIELPAGWQAEGIASGPGTIVYSGSRATGDIVAVDVLTGEREVVVDAPDRGTTSGSPRDRPG